MNRRQFLTTASAVGLTSVSGCGGSKYDHELLNVSYDPTRGLYRTINRLFAADYLEKTGKRVRVRQSHGGSGSQARAVNDGIAADVVTLAMWSDVDSIRAKGLIEPGWDNRPPGSLPYLSTIVFVVRKGNPYGVADWPDLIQPGLQIITPNPKTSGGAKLNVLGAWIDVLRRPGKTAADARDFVTELFRRVPVLDTGARGATMTFAKKNIGDVHLTWENEAELERRELKGTVEIIRPPVSIRAEPHVALVRANTSRKGTTEVATAYLEFLHSPAAQEVISELFFRPVNWRDQSRFAGTTLISPVEKGTKYYLGSWDTIQKDFFTEGGIFDQVYGAGR
jgi:sulfate/thiosulfate transport system substrate-binding protein